MTDRRKAAGIVGLAVMGSRILGLVREVVIAGMFNAGKFLDSFLAAFQIPNLLRDLFAEGALSTAFTTVFAKTLEKEGEPPAWHLASLLFSALILFMGLICVIGIAASPLLVQITNFGFHQVPGKFELTVSLTRILFPFIMLVSLASVVMGILNARFIFGLPASASTVFNLVSVISSVALAYGFDPQSDWRHPHFSERALYGVSLGVMLGGLAQLGMQLPALWKQGYRFHWHLDFSDPRLRQVWALAWPSMIAGSAVQVNVLINGIFASEIDGARSWLYCAFRLMQFPIGVFGVAIATVTLPAVARLHARGEMREAGKTIEEALRLALFLTIPAAVGLAVLAPEIIRAIYEHFKFTAASTAATASALRAYAIGLSAYAAIKVLTPCFYALDRRRTPLNVSLVGIGICLVLNLVLMKVFHMGHVGLAVTTSCVAILNFVQLALYLRRDVKFGRLRDWARFGSLIGLAALACGITAWLLKRWLAGYGQSPFWLVMALLLEIAIASLVYFGLTLVFRIHETHYIVKMMRKKILGKVELVSDEL
ncbi:MAG: murein biosynthesis integral membrane protein MurJ [bacterium]